MAYIRVDVAHTVKNGTCVSFKAPCNCDAVNGLHAYYPGELGAPTSKVFVFTDAHGDNLTGLGNLFVAGAVIKVILNVDDGQAYIQNADTNAYLEKKFSGITPASIGAAPKDHTHSKPTAAEIGGKVYAATFKANSWALDSNGYYSQTVPVSGLKASYVVAPRHDVVLSGTDPDGDAATLEGFACISIVETGANSITARCVEEAPEVSVPIRMVVWE